MSLSLTLHDILHVPRLSYNLLSVSKLACDQNCQTNFFSTHCVFQDLTSRRMTDNAKQSGGLYFFDDGSESRWQSQQISLCFKFIYVSNNNNNSMLWHLRLGHPSFRYLKHLFPKLFINKDPPLFHCENCEFVKYHHTSFPSQPYKPSKLFTIIYSDVWGPNMISTPSKRDGSSHLQMIILDFARCIYWKKNQKLNKFLKFFYNMVQIQFRLIYKW